MEDKNKLNLEEKDVTPKEEIVPTELALDDASRVKVLSPGAMVFKRFIKNKLAIIGTCLLAFMFLFCFVGAWISPYGEDEIFYKYEYFNADYASAVNRTSFDTYYYNYGNTTLGTVFKSRLGVTHIKTVNASDTVDKDGNLYAVLEDNGISYTYTKLGDGVYALYGQPNAEVSTVKNGTWSFKADFKDLESDLSFRSKVENSNGGSFVYNGNTYVVSLSTTKPITKTVSFLGNENVLLAISSRLVFDMYDHSVTASNSFKEAAYLNLYNGKTFVVDGVSYVSKYNEEDESYEITNTANNAAYCYASSFVVKDYKGYDSLSIDYKKTVQDAIETMLAGGLNTYKFEYETAIYDEQGNMTMELVEHLIEKKDNNYSIRASQVKRLIDIYGAPSKTHLLGTEANGMDVLTRIMYGGRISLMVGFIVIFFEVILGVLLGGIAGYFGGRIDSLIMRLVDIFNCIPFLPIMVIMGSMFDTLQFSGQQRIIWMMVIMGVLGWSGVARLVRGQILSLREQEFMIAAEATGLSTRKKIFRHLVPNVMPQLIVSATMGLGSVILTESTLSFLGLGAKFPMATWGAMINLVSNATALQNYTYIWVPIGLLISLTVIAFNFVGDGLRDAFDPKMKT